MNQDKMHLINKIFNSETIRTIWDKENEKYYVSVVDIVRILTDSKNPRHYWNVLKGRLKDEGNETVTNCDQLKLKAQDGSKTTSFISCVAFGQIADTTSKFTRKGSLVGVEGTIRQRRYQKQDGSNASVFEIICDSVQFLEPKGTRGDVDEVPPFDDAPAPAESESRNLDAIDLPDDDLPF